MFIGGRQLVTFSLQNNAKYFYDIKTLNNYKENYNTIKLIRIKNATKIK